MQMRMCYVPYHCFSLGCISLSSRLSICVRQVQSAKSDVVGYHVLYSPTQCFIHAVWFS
jgi:hypothetical protein